MDKGFENMALGLVGRGKIQVDYQQKALVIDEVANWIDTQVIAEMIVEHLEDNGIEPTVEECKKVWYGTLQNLGGGVGLAIS